MACALAALLVLAGAGTAAAQEELEDDGNYAFIHDALGLGPVAMFLQGDGIGADFRDGWVEEGEQLTRYLPNGTYELDIFPTDVVTAEPLATATVTLEVNRVTTVTLVVGEDGEPELVTSSTAIQPSMSASPDPASPGQELEVAGAHFPPGSQVEVTFGEGSGALYAYGTPEADGGTFLVGFVVPRSFAGPPGSTVTVPITATVIEGGTGSASMTIDVVAGPAPSSSPSARPRVVTPSRVEAGGGGAAPDSGPVPMAMVGVLGGVAVGIAVLVVVRRSAR